MLRVSAYSIKVNFKKSAHRLVFPGHCVHGSLKFLGVCGLLGVQLGWHLLGAPSLLHLFQTEAAAQCLTCVVHRFEKTFLN